LNEQNQTPSNQQRPRTTRKQSPKTKPASPSAPEAGPSTTDTRHNFYAKVLDEADKLELPEASGIKGLDDEIEVLRLMIRKLLEADPENENFRLVMEATNLLSRLVMNRYKMNQKQGKNVGEAIRAALKEVAVPLGVTFLEKKL